MHGTRNGVSNVSLSFQANGRRDVPSEAQMLGWHSCAMCKPTPEPKDENGTSGVRCRLQSLLGAPTLSTCFASFALTDPLTHGFIAEG